MLSFRVFVLFACCSCHSNEISLHATAATPAHSPFSLPPSKHVDSKTATISCSMTSLPGSNGTGKSFGFVHACPHSVTHHHHHLVLICSHAFKSSRVTSHFCIMPAFDSSFKTAFKTSRGLTHRSSLALRQSVTRCHVHARMHAYDASRECSVIASSLTR
jgi:hypothetical protein